MENRSFTKNQHYVPQVYLRGFSEDNTRVWSYPLESTDSGKLVPIKSVCHQKYLYEIYKNNGEIVAPNWMENTLSKFESMYADYLRALKRKAYYKENYKTKCFLSTKEKLFWMFFVTLQMMRSPSVLQVAQTFADEFFGNQLLDYSKRSLAIYQCLPFFGELKSEDQNAFFSFLKPILNMSVAIGVDENETLFTSDDPVYCYSPHKDITQLEEYERIVMPLTSSLVLIMLGGEAAKGHDRNRLFRLSDEDKQCIKMSIAYAARSRVFSERELGNTDREIIESARKDKIQDEAEAVQRED